MSQGIWDRTGRIVASQGYAPGGLEVSMSQGCPGWYVLHVQSATQRTRGGEMTLDLSTPLAVAKAEGASGLTVRFINDTPAADRVRIEYKARWYPGVIGTWDRLDGSLRCWVTYPVPVNGWPGGWYWSPLGDDGDEPNGEDRDWLARVREALGA